RQTVEQVRLVEASHRHEPIHNFAVAIEAKRAVRAPPDRMIAEIQFRRGAAVQDQFRAASRGSLLKGAVIDGRKRHRPLPFVGLIADEVDLGTMGLDPRYADVRQAIRFAAIEKVRDGIVLSRTRLHRHDSADARTQLTRFSARLRPVAAIESPSPMPRQPSSITNTEKPCRAASSAE